MKAGVHMRERKNINLEVGRNIQTAREQAGYTQDALSERMGITPNHLSAIERGVSGISLETLSRLCRLLGVSAFCSAHPLRMQTRRRLPAAFQNSPRPSAKPPALSCPLSPKCFKNAFKKSRRDRISFRAQRREMTIMISPPSTFVFRGKKPSAICSLLLEA